MDAQYSSSTFLSKQNIPLKQQQQQQTRIHRYNSLSSDWLEATARIATTRGRFQEIRRASTMQRV